MIAPPSLQTVRSVLVIQFRFMGDLVLLSALLHNLRLHFPRAHLAVLCDESYRPVLEAQPDVDEIMTFGRERTRRGPIRGRFGEWLRAVRALRARRFDLAVDVADTRTSYLAMRLARARLRVGYRPSQRRRKFWEGQPYNVFAEPFGPGGKHFLDRYLAPLAALGLRVVDREPRLRARPEDGAAVAALMREHGLSRRGFAVVHPGARVPNRCWPPGNFARVVDEIEGPARLRAVLVGGAPERELADEILAATASAPVDLVGKLSFGALLALLQQCRLYVGNDTGPMHLAAAAGAPVVALFGLQSPELWGPVGADHIVVRPSMPCPCPTPEICRPPEPNATLCVRRNPVEDVVAAVRAILARQAA